MKTLELERTQEDRRSGVIATLTDGTVVHVPGGRLDARRAVAALCDERGVKVRCLSTPQTIYTDLQGAREEHGNGRARANRATESPAWTRLPEVQMLGVAGRSDLAAS